MKTKPTLFFIGLSSILFVSCTKDPVSFQPTNPVARDFVHVENGQLLDTTGRPLLLKGVNLGSWLLWEAWIWGGGMNGETWINQTITNRTSASYAQSFRQRIYQQFITRDDIRAIASMGMNSIRVPFNHAFFDDGGTDIIQSRFNILDSLVNWCETYKVYIVFDFHGLPGGQNPLFISDPDATKVWDSDANKAQAAKIWKAIAARYVNRKIVLGYDLMNEPSVFDPMKMVNLYSQLIAAVREVDNNHLLIIEGNNYAKDFSIFETVMDNNQIFSFHFYPWLVAQSEWPAKLREFDQFARKVRTPMWCGEWGEMAPSDLAAARQMLMDTATYKFCGNAFWTWKKVKLTGNLPVQTINVSEDWKRMISNQTKNGSQTYEQIGDSFLDAALYNNTTLTPEMRAVMTY